MRALPYLGVVLLWAIAVGAFFKFVLSEGIARWQLATGTTALEGWAEHLPAWVKFYFGAYLVFWTVGVSAALTNATGLGISNLTGGWARAEEVRQPAYWARQLREPVRFGAGIQELLRGSARVFLEVGPGATSST